ncbi:MAG TPA: hypothetical protein VMT44_05785 [Methanoregula sp.]|nr:hypothetical protein [Methanoregula sp.]
MDTGKILLGIALVLFSAALMVNPSSAAGNDTSREVGNGSAAPVAGCAMLTETLHGSTGAAGPAGTIGGYCRSPDPGRP